MLIGTTYLLRCSGTRKCKVGITKLGRLPQRIKEIDRSYKTEKVRYSFALPVFYPEKLEDRIEKRFELLKWAAPKGVSGRTEFYKMYWIERQTVKYMILIEFFILLAVLGLPTILAIILIF